MTSLVNKLREARDMALGLEDDLAHLRQRNDILAAKCDRQEKEILLWKQTVSQLNDQLNKQAPKPAPKPLPMPTGILQPLSPRAPNAPIGNLPYDKYRCVKMFPCPYCKAEPLQACRTDKGDDCFPHTARQTLEWASRDATLRDNAHRDDVYLKDGD